MQDYIQLNAQHISYLQRNPASPYSGDARNCRCCHKNKVLDLLNSSDSIYGGHGEGSWPETSPFLILHRCCLTCCLDFVLLSVECAVAILICSFYMSTLRIYCIFHTKTGPNIRLDAFKNLDIHYIHLNMTENKYF